MEGGIRKRTATHLAGCLPYFFHSFKVECIAGEYLQTRAQARSITFEFIECFYNQTRRHSTLRYMSPLEYEQLMCSP
ncbi:MAG: IS3 family transposase [Ktedonobacteraceae bacterium]|nr:IS3 family transposase [Ktedonobacteraceae bacterium]